MELARPKVSVLMLAYNHENFIGQALDSVLMQRVGCEYEVVIGEDRSTDGTLAILREYGKKHSSIRILANERNLGPGGNLARTWKTCRGQYVAILEGDDYWTDPLKLQSQIEFLDNHPDFSMCCHRVEVVSSGGRLICERPEMTRDCSLLVEDLRFTDPVPTLSVMYRGGLVPEIPDWLVPSKMCDWPLNILHALRGPVWYSSRVMGTYRIHSGGVWSGGDPLEKALTTLQVFAALERHLVPEQKVVARFGQFTALQRMVDAAVTAGNRWVACRYALRALRVAGLPGIFRARCVLVLRALLPDGLFSRLRRFGPRQLGRSLDAASKEDSRRSLTVR